MTSLYLLLWIAAGILLQLAIYAGIVFWRHWQNYLALRHSVAELDMAPTLAPDAQDPTPLAWSGWRPFRVERRVIEDDAQETCSFYLQPEDGQALPPYLPGQFLTFRLDIPSLTGDAAPTVRCYSLSDAPNAQGYRVSIKRAPAPSNGLAPAGRASHYFHDHVTIGSVVQVRAPSGHFHIDRSEAPVVLVGGGIGITPMLSMLNWCLSAQPERDIWLFYGVRHRREMVMKSHLQALATRHPNFHLQLCCSQPQPDDLAGDSDSYRGRIDVDLMRRLLPLKPFHFYICGPTPMLESLVPALQDWGVPDGRIHFEAFGPASIPRKKSARAASAAAPTETPNAGDSGILVTFSQSGMTLPWTPAAGNLLDFAEAHGIPVSSGCRAGSCGTCQTNISAGEVAYHQAPEYDPAPGSCLLCVCLPKTHVTLEA